MIFPPKFVRLSCPMVTWPNAKWASWNYGVLSGPSTFIYCTFSMDSMLETRDCLVYLGFGWRKYKVQGKKVREMIILCRYLSLVCVCVCVCVSEQCVFEGVLFPFIFPCHSTFIPIPSIPKTHRLFLFLLIPVHLVRWSWAFVVATCQAWSHSSPGKKRKRKNI